MVDWPWMRTVLLPRPSKRAFRTARQAHWGWLSLDCPDTTDEQLKAPWGSRLHRVAQAVHPQQNNYTLARQYAERMMDQAEALMPGFCQWSGGADFRFALLFHLQFFLINHGLPFYYPAMQRLQARKQTQALVVHGYLTPDLLTRLQQDYGLDSSMTGDSPVRWTCRSALSRSRLNQKLRQWRNAAEQKAPALSPPWTGLSREPVSGGVLALLSHQVHQAVLTPTVAALASRYPVIWLPTRPNLSVSPAQAVAAGQQQVVAAGWATDALAPDERLDAALAHFNGVAQRVAGLRSDVDRQFCYNQLDLLMDLAEKWLRLAAVVQMYQPAVVLGCMEYGTDGCLASMLRAQYPFRLINVQHGFISPGGAMDGLAFDDFLIWNAESAARIADNGYQRPETLRVLGNPDWEVLAANVQAAVGSPALSRVLDWKGSARLLGAYTQCIQGYSTGEVKRAYVQALLCYVQAHRDVKLLIKPHPLEDDDIVAQVVAQAEPSVQERVRMLRGSELSLWESFQAVDVVTSVFSAVLVDALYLRKPAVALDFSDTLAQQHIPLHTSTAVVRDPAQVTAALNQALAQAQAGEQVQAGMPPSAVQDGGAGARGDIHEADPLARLVPRFTQPYADRVRQVLFGPE